MRTTLSSSLVLLVLAAASPTHADVTTTSGPGAGLRTPDLDMGQTQVVYGMNKKGNYGGGN